MKSTQPLSVRKYFACYYYVLKKKPKWEQFAYDFAGWAYIQTNGFNKKFKRRFLFIDWLRVHGPITRSGDIRPVAFDYTRSYRELKSYHIKTNAMHPVMPSFLAQFNGMEKRIIKLRLEDNTFKEIGDYFNRSEAWALIVFQKIQQKAAKHV